MKKLPLILAVLSMVAAACVTALFFSTKGKLDEREIQLKSAQANLDDTKDKLTLAQSQASSLGAELKTERSVLAQNKQNLESVRSEMYTSRNEASAAQLKLASTEKKITEIENNLRTVSSQLVSSEKDLKNSSKSGEIAQLQERISELESINDSLQAELKTAQAAHQAAKEKQLASAAPSASAWAAASSSTPSGSTTADTRSAPTAQAPAMPNSTIITPFIGPETTITFINKKDGLLVLENSESLALAPGQELRLVQNLKLVGTVQIVENTNNQSIANILPGSNTRALKTGATVTLMR
jgi:myosin heavy subunit